MKSFNVSLIALAMSCAAASAGATSLAITNATVHTATEQGVLTNATVVVEDGKIIAINPATVTADSTYDAQGKILTPGFIGTMNALGIVEVGAVASSRDAGDKKAEITFDPSLAFNPMSSAIPYSRKGGLTRNVSAPAGGESIFKGQTFVASLTGKFDSVEQSNTAVVVGLGAKNEGSRAFDLQELINKLEDAQKKLTKAKTTAKTDKKTDKANGDDQELKRDEEVINALLAGSKMLIVQADRASDLLQLIKLKARFDLDLVIQGAGDAVVVANELAAAKVPVIIHAMDNLPGSFDSLHASLASAAKLTDAGVKVALYIGDPHALYQLRFTAGNAIANGLSSEAALASITANVADIFHLNAGRIAVGKVADLVLWSADPFELSSKVDQMWIEGEAYTTESRQDALRKRYTTDSNMARGYTRYP